VVQRCSGASTIQREKCHRHELISYCDLRRIEEDYNNNNLKGCLSTRLQVPTGAVLNNNNEASRDIKS
jgi:hypothetical protein